MTATAAETAAVTVEYDENWSRRAQCKGTDLDAMFVRGAAQNKAKNGCAGCPVIMECLAEALDENMEWGVWGGMTERERRALLKSRPNVTSWRKLLMEARKEQLEVHAKEQMARRVEAAQKRSAAARQALAARKAAPATRPAAPFQRTPLRSPAVAQPSRPTPAVQPVVRTAAADWTDAFAA
jgi:WhiB family transcriptional regulator, redox-sensing transcriptional regulator